MPTDGDTAPPATPRSLASAEIRPAPTDAEAVAIVAAVEALWPRRVVVATDEPPRRSTWRFSGRWWSVPLPVRRDRPWR